MTTAGLIDDAVGASRETAARVIGITEDRLRQWANRRLVEPSSRPRVGQQSFAMYSLEDIVQGRIVSYLLDHGVSARQTGQIVRAFRSTEHPHPLASLRWAVSGREAFVQLGDEWYGGRKPGQGVLPDTIDLEEIRVDARRKLQRPAELAGQITRRQGVQGSRPVFAGTRVPVATVEQYLKDGIPPRSILESFPSLYEADVAVVQAQLAS